jgi:D-alanyl-D-alanine carboxypeptidase
LGTAFDFRAADGPAPWTIDFEQTRAGRWLATHAGVFGFVMSYPKGKADVTCYAFEPWHFRWVGREVAHMIEASGLTPREWLSGIRNESRVPPRHTQ